MMEMNLSAGRRGLVIEGYRLERPLGAGAYGEVWAVQHTLTNKRKAVKILRAEFRDRSDLRQRFAQEACALAQLEDPGIVQFDNLGELADGTPYILMELLHGQTLFERLQREGRLREHQAVRYAWQVALTMHAAHQRGIVHRDLKPANLMLCADPVAPGGERIKLLDFGIAKLLHERPDGAQLTQEPIGTWAYMSPEQFENQPCDGKMDVYALGVVLYEMVAGRCPFIGNPASIALQHVSKRPPPVREVSEAAVDEALQTLLFSMLEKLPQQRSSMQEVADRLESMLTSSSSRPAATRVPAPSASARPLARRGSRRARLGMIAAGALALTVPAALWQTLRSPGRPLPAPPPSQVAESLPAPPLPKVAELPPAPTVSAPPAPPDLAPVPAPFVPSCSQDGWCTVPPIADIKHLSRVWGPSAREVWASGDLGSLVRFDGETWSKVPLPLADAPRLPGLFGLTASSVWLAGDRGTLLRYDGRGWSPVATGLDGNFTALWGAATGELWAIGRSGAVAHRGKDGAWMPANAGTSRNLYSIWGSGPQDIWSVGAAGTLLHYDGKDWTAADPGTRQSLYAIWGRSSTDIWAVGRKGTIVHYDGQSWSLKEAGTDADLGSICGWPEDAELWVAGNSGTVLRWNGETWRKSDSGLTAGLSEIWGATPTDLWVVGDQGVMLRNQKQTAHPLPATPPPPAALDRGPVGPELPEQLTWQLRQVLTALAPQTQRCGKADTYHVKFIIAPSGQVTWASAPGFDTDAPAANDRPAQAAACILTVLKQTRFPAFIGRPQTVFYPFIIR